MKKESKWEIKISIWNGKGTIVNYTLSQRIGADHLKQDYRICKNMVKEMLFLFRLKESPSVRSDISFTINNGDGKEANLIYTLGKIPKSNKQLTCYYGDALFLLVPPSVAAAKGYIKPVERILTKKFKTSATGKRIFNRLKRFEASIKKELKARKIPVKKDEGAEMFRFAK